MIGVLRNSTGSGDLLLKDGQLIIKNREAGNFDNSGSETNDFVIGEIGDNLIANDFAKFKGGAKKDSNNYEYNGFLDKNDYPDL